MSGPNPQSLLEEVEGAIRAELRRQADEGELWYEHLANVHVDRIDGDLDVTALANRLIDWFSRN